MMSKPLRIVSIVGARPQFVKLAPVCRAVAAHNAYGGARSSTSSCTRPALRRRALGIFFEELEIPRADINLGVGSGPHGQQTGRMLE